MDLHLELSSRLNKNIYIYIYIIKKKKSLEYLEQNQAKMGKFPFCSKYIAFYPLFQTNSRNTPILKLDF